MNATPLTPSARLWIRAKRAMLRADSGILSIRFSYCTVPKLGAGDELDGIACHYDVRGIRNVQAGSFDVASGQPFRFA